MSSQACYKSECENQTLSIYCDQHRCAESTCHRAKLSANQYCAQHTICKKIGCDTPRYHPEEDEGFAPYCADHWWSCRKLDCGQSVWETSHISPYCTVHGCQSPGCSIPALDDRTLCAAHVCRVSGQLCSEDGADYHAGRFYCHSHTCGVPGCFDSTVDPNESTNGVYVMCPQHRCPATNCQQVRRNNSAYCSNHTICGKKKCREAKAIGEKWCQVHANTCCKEDCYEARSPYGYWYDPGIFRSMRWCHQGYSKGCSKHKCAVPDCGRTQEYHLKRLYCGDHTICGKRGCIFTRSTSDRFCGYHRTSCGVEDCFGYMYGYDGSYKGFCENHACKMVKQGCSAKRQPNRMLCDQHRKCATPRCTAVCKIPDIACNPHQCYAQSCVNAVCSLVSKYCQHHVCTQDGCFDPQDRVFDYSASHTFCSNHIPTPGPVPRARIRHDSASVIEECRPSDVDAETQDIVDEHKDSEGTNDDVVVISSIGEEITKVTSLEEIVEQI